MFEPRGVQGGSRRVRRLVMAVMGAAVLAACEPAPPVATPVDLELSATNNGGVRSFVVANVGGTTSPTGESIHLVFDAVDQPFGINAAQGWVCSMNGLGTYLIECSWAAELAPTAETGVVEIASVPAGAGLGASVDPVTGETNAANNSAVSPG